MIQKCDCKAGQAAKFQDQTYGVGMRVMNEKKNGVHATCTVCGKQHGITNAKAPEVKASKQQGRRS